MNEKKMLDYLECLDDKSEKCDCDNPLHATMTEGGCVDAVQAIRTAIVRLGGCTKRAVEIMDDAEKLDHETWEEVVMEFLEDIRDFGEEGK